MSENRILIAAASDDEHAFRPVRDILEAKDYPVVVYRTDKVLGGDERFTISLTSDKPTITYEGTDISPGVIAAAWYRKVGSFALPDADTNLAKQLYMNNELRSMHGTIWPLYRDELWLNAPGAIARADQKLRQLLVARSLGFSVLDTMVTNDWEAVDEFREGHGDTLAIKMMRGIIAEGNQIKGFHTTPLDSAKIAGVRETTVPFPGLIQPFADKHREWRVTAVGEDVFSAAIYTDETAKDDWRKHQMTSAVMFRDEPFPDEASELCLQYLKQMGLQYGAFDFIERESGEIIFLECNPNGQYGWLEEDLGFPISHSIAASLIKIARQ